MPTLRIARGKNHMRYLFLAFVFIHSLSFSQTTSSDAQEPFPIPDIEKTYVHTDRSYYTMGESVWYKAYVVYAYNNLLFDKSNVLYVELISPDSKIIARNKTRLEQGLGHGDFKLTDSTGVKPGRYQIRAYTNWSRNFGTDFIFEKEIEILDVFDSHGDDENVVFKSDEKTATENSTNVIPNTFSVQFFPEGGSLIENIISAVAFKAVDQQGKPIAVQGKVFDSDGKLIDLLGSVHDGMGKFHIKPINGKQYYALVKTLNGSEIKIPLPKAKKQGYLLSLSTIKDKEIVTVKTNPETLLQHPNSPITLIGTTKGISYFEVTQPLTTTKLAFELPTNDLPDGITQLTLYDAELRPQSERLLYIEKEHDLAVTLTTDKPFYKTKEKVLVHISSTTSTGAAVPACFSLSSIDMNGVKETKDHEMNISSYFLMQSDIRGKVFNPGNYFDTSNPQRLKQLDLLLLTQGWRDFLWKKLPEIKDSLTYAAEKGITISGTVKQLFGKKAKENSNVTLAILNKGKSNMLFGVTDSIGEFKFENLVFMGPATMMLNTQNEDGKNRGMFVLDSLHQPPLQVDFQNDGTNSIPENDSIKENVRQKHIMFGVAAENVLDEVEVFAKKKSETPSLYGNPDHSYVVDEKTQHFSTIYQLIQFSIPGVTAFDRKVGFSRYGGQPAYLLIDGVPWEQESLASIQPDDVAKIESMNGPSAAIFGSQGGFGVILIYTKQGAANSNYKKVFHSIVKLIDGFYDARMFYSPDEESAEIAMDNSAAIRNTLYWNPYIFPDEAGTAQVTYENSEVETTVKITLEGLTATGVPVVAKTYYTIEK
tara:strand:- start:17778 stop:20237 length:2460 start_codon:yes stop_codon:yes gene_type:complete